MDEERSTSVTADTPGPVIRTVLQEGASPRRFGFLSGLTAPVVDEIRRTMSDIIERRKRNAADRLGSVAKGLHQVSEETEAKNRLVSRVAEAAAGRVENLSETIRDRPVEEIARSAGDYLRKRPVLVLGGGILVGFIIARLVGSGAVSRKAPASGTPEGTRVH